MAPEFNHTHERSGLQAVCASGTIGHMKLRSEGVVSKIIESLRGDLAALMGRGAIDQVTMRECARWMPQTFEKA